MLLIGRPIDWLIYCCTARDGQAELSVFVFAALLSAEQRAVDSDENIMEGGVTIRRRRKTRAPVTPLCT